MNVAIKNKTRSANKKSKQIKTMRLDCISAHHAPAGSQANTHLTFI